MSLLIKYTFYSFSCSYIYLKIVKKKYSVRRYFFLICCILLSSLLSFLISKHNIYFAFLALFISLYVSITKCTATSYNLSLNSILIAFGLSFSIYSFSGILIGIVFFAIYRNSNMVPYTYTDVPVGLIQFIIVFFLFRIKRFQNGVSLLLHSYKIPSLTAFSLILIAYTLLIFVNKVASRPIRFTILILLLFISFTLLLLWRHRITQTYREKLRLANEKSLEDELNKHKETIANLEADNARLSQIVHKDNKIILAMLTAVTEHLENATNATPDEQIIRGKELSAQLHDMANERQGILNTQSKLPNALPKSGLHTVDGMLSFMETRAKETGITYKLQLEENIKELAGKSIDEADLLHLLGDLIDNALIATEHTNNQKEILIHLGSLQGHFLLEISDSGIPFSLETYQHFGNEQHTTHSEDGGSGIGLMDIWKLKKKYKASLHIYEYEDVEGIYTKKLAFIFDRKNHFLLQTPRYKEATYALTRGDLYIFSNKEE